MSRSTKETRLHRSTTQTAILAAASLTLSACITPPALFAGGSEEIPWDDFPEARAASTTLESGETLRGLWVPAEPGAPLVLHFLESSGSFSDGRNGMRGYPLFEELRQAGFASLVFDYRGVGPSDGERSPRNLPEDARAMWSAAAELGGDPSQIVLRGMSMGALAVSALLEDGAEPAGVVLVAPVRAETVAVNSAYNQYSWPVAWVLSLLLRDAADTDLLAALASTEAPLFVALADQDDFVRPKELEEIADVVRGRGGRVVRNPELDHIDTVLESHRLTEAEAEFLASLFPAVPPVAARVERVLEALGPDEARLFQVGAPHRARLEQVVSRAWFEEPRVSAALCLLEEPLEHARSSHFRTWVHGLGSGVTGELPLDALAELLSFADPEGELDVRELPAMARRAQAFEEADDAAELARSLELAWRATWSNADEGRRGIWRYWDVELEADSREGVLPEDAPERLELPQVESERQAIRLLLKAKGLPNRAMAAPARGGNPSGWSTGRWVTEVWNGTTWR